MIAKGGGSTPRNNTDKYEWERQQNKYNEERRIVEERAILERIKEIVDNQRRS